VALAESGVSFGGEAHLDSVGHGAVGALAEVAVVEALEVNVGSDAEVQQVLCTAKQLRKYRNSAIYRLAKREHSYHELNAKLKERFPDFDHGLIEGVLARLVEDGQLSDQRFTESYIRMRWRKSFGPQRIARELRERGVCAALITDGLTCDEYDWYASAQEARVKKFGDGESIDFKVRMKQQSFLHYRGFDHEQIHHAFD